MIKENVKLIMKNAAHLHFAGIGGISMSSLALWAVRHGFTVTGSDRVNSPILDTLRENGITVRIGQNTSNVEGADAVIYSVALKPDNPELVAANRMGIPTLTRGEFLGYMMSFYRVRIGISGTHGKSTTTAMLSHIFLQAGADPTIACGAVMPEIGGASKIGGDKNTFIYEACEYRDSFLAFCPTDAVITNIELDHTDYFADLDAVIHSFKESIKEAECVYINVDNKNTRAAVTDFKGEVVTVSTVDPSATFYAADLSFRKGCGSYTLVHRGKELCRITLPVIGAFNVSNSLCAAAVAYSYMIPPAQIARSLADFVGVDRRFQHKGDMDGIAIYDDYAHHPDEVQATLSGLSALDYGKVYLVFQPHTYTRTRDLWSRWVEVFRYAADHGITVILADIYAARESDTLGVSSRKLADETGALYFPDFAAITNYLRTVAVAGDLILTMGAGQANRVGEMLLK